MIKTKSIVLSYTDVPITWAYEFYCNLPEKLTGQDIKIKSMLNPRDTNPSMVIYYRSGKYKWKDFSTGIGGNDVELVKRLFNINEAEAIQKIVKDYSKYIDNNSYSRPEIVESSRYKLSNAVVRSWNNLDAAYWQGYNVSSDILERYNVKPLESFTFSKEDDPEKSFEIKTNYIYGYYNSSGQLCKIYRPKAKEYKFMKVLDYMQGSDQLEFIKPYLVICSSLKDAMCLLSFGYNLEVIVPDSENSMIRYETIALYKRKYKSICTMMDNDEAGLKSMNKYKDEYGLPYLHLDLEKDLSDAVKKYGVNEVRKHLEPLLRITLKNNN